MPDRYWRERNDTWRKGMRTPLADELRRLLEEIPNSPHKGRFESVVTELVHVEELVQLLVLQFDIDEAMQERTGATLH